MSEISVSWVAVSRSAWRQHLRRGALSLTAGVAAAVALVLIFDSDTVALAGGAIAMCVVALAGGTVREPKSRASWCVSRDGRVWVRWDAGADAPDAVQAAFVSSFLIVLRQGWRTLEVWRDVTPAPAFRRLAVAVRWRVARDVSIAVNDRDAADRT